MSDPDSFIGQLVGDIDNAFEFVAVLVYMILLGAIAITGMILKAYFPLYEEPYTIIALFTLGLGIKGVSSKAKALKDLVPSKKILEVK